MAMKQIVIEVDDAGHMGFKTNVEDPIWVRNTLKLAEELLVSQALRQMKPEPDNKIVTAHPSVLKRLH